MVSKSRGRSPGGHGPGVNDRLARFAGGPGRRDPASAPASGAGMEAVAS